MMSGSQLDIVALCPGGTGSLSLAQLGVLLALTAARLLPIVVLTPLFGGQGAPARLRIGLLVLLAAALLPTVIAGSASAGVPTDATRVVVLVAKELFVGVGVAVIIQAMFGAYAAAGAIVDVSRGASNMEIFSPLNRQPESPLGMALSLCAVCVFLALGGHALLLTALADAYAVLPPTSMSMPGTLGVDAASQAVVLDVMGILLRTSVMMAAPAIVTLFLIDVAFGLLNRASPSINVSMLSAGLRSWVGLGVLGLSLMITFSAPIRELGGLVLRALGLGGGGGA